MKKIYALIAALILSATITTNAQNVYIPDSIFKAALVGNTKINTNGDTAIQVSEAVAFKGFINVNYLSYKSVSNLIGIQEFINIDSLDCGNNKLTSLDITKNTALSYLSCFNNRLTSLNITLNKALKYLYCGGNPLTSLDVSANKALIYLFCDEDKLNNLDVSANKALTVLTCNKNNLTNLDVTTNAVLYTLGCVGNQLTTLNISKNTALISLACYNNQLTSLNVSANKTLAYLQCGNNQLSNLDVSANTVLVTLLCAKNKLTELNMRNGYNDSLIYFDATNNPSLTCIQVDSVADMNTHWGNNKDAIASYSTDCNYSSIQENTNNTTLSIYPNPANNQITINTNGNFHNSTLRIVDILGNEVVKGTLQKETSTIDISHLGNGIYFVKVGDSSYKFIKN